MSHDKIIQLMPAPANLWAKYSETVCPVVAMALVEDEAGYRRVELLDLTAGDAQIEPVNADVDFEGLVFDETRGGMMDRFGKSNKL